MGRCWYKLLDRVEVKFTLVWPDGEIVRWFPGTVHRLTCSTVGVVLDGSNVLRELDPILVRPVEEQADG